MQKRILIGLLASAVLTAGSGAIATAETSAAGAAHVFPVKDAFIRYRKAKHSHSVSAVNLAHQNITLAWTDGPGGRATFEGKPATTFISNYKSSVNGETNFTATDTEYFTPDSYTPIGTSVEIASKRGPGKRYSVLSKTSVLPKFAHIGDSGLYAEIQGYDDAKKANVVDRRKSTWKLEPDPQSPNGALFCISDIIMPAATPDVVQTASECYHEDLAGNFTTPFEIDGTTTTLH